MYTSYYNKEIIFIDVFDCLHFQTEGYVTCTSPVSFFSNRISQKFMSHAQIWHVHVILYSQEIIGSYNSNWQKLKI